jgi:thiamine pyrophosphate-dependent acetolactate synthase large subunit-like protein
MWFWKRRRGLFRYHNGRRWVYADPLPLYRKVLKEADQLVVLGAAFDQQKDPEASEFVQKLAEIFELTRYDPQTGRGLTDAEVVAVFQQFDAFLREIRENFFPGSTSPPRSAGGSSPAPESASQTPVGGSP